MTIFTNLVSEKNFHDQKTIGTVKVADSDVF